MVGELSSIFAVSKAAPKAVPGFVRGGSDKGLSKRIVGKTQSEAERVAELQRGVVKPKVVKEKRGGARTSRDITPKKPVSRANLFGSAQSSPGLKKKLGA